MTIKRPEGWPVTSIQQGNTTTSTPQYVLNMWPLRTEKNLSLLKLIFSLVFFSLKPTVGLSGIVCEPFPKGKSV
jgi:hypothetical protein